MKIQLSDHFTLSKLLRFVFPSIIMMIFTSIYSVVDGLFVSNFVGKTAFASLHFPIPPVLCQHEPYHKQAEKSIGTIENFLKTALKPRA